MGFAIAYQLQRGNDLTSPLHNLIQRISAFFSQLFSKGAGRSGPKVAYKNPNLKKQKAGRAARFGSRTAGPEDLSHQERLDAILDKIKKSGYDSLSPSEKEFLFNASKK
jgi:hypothetical protein